MEQIRDELDHIIGPINDCAAAVLEQMGIRPVVAVIHPLDWPGKHKWVRFNTPAGPVRLIKLPSCPLGQVYCLSRAQLAEVVRHERKIRAEIALIVWEGVKRRPHVPMSFKILP